MHRSQKISNGNSLQFRRHRCSNVAYGCILGPLQLHFQFRKRKIVGWTQIRRVWGMVKSFAWTTLCSRCFAVNACGRNCTHSFHFFQIITQNAVNDGFWYTCTHRYHPSTSTVVVLLNSCQMSDIFIHFFLFFAFLSTQCFQSPPHWLQTGYAIEMS